MRRLFLIFLAYGSVATSGPMMFSQSPTITHLEVKETRCVYLPGSSDEPCSIGPGMTLWIKGANFGEQGGTVSLCDCGGAIINRWTPDSITATVSYVAPNSVFSIETTQGAYSNSLSYSALAPIIDRVHIGDCTYIPGVSRHLCMVVPGSQITIRGKYFGRGSGEVATCDCANATIDSWNPDWLLNPTPAENTITVTAVDAECGSTISVQADGMWSNAVPYTTCDHK
jgi:hypothetical protein